MKDERSVKAVDTAIAFGEGKVTIEKLNIAATNAFAAVYSVLSEDSIFYSASAAAYFAAICDRTSLVADFYCSCY